jgi:hypothetical protein
MQPPSGLHADLPDSMDPVVSMQREPSSTRIYARTPMYPSVSMRRDLAYPFVADSVAITIQDVLHHSPLVISRAEYDAFELAKRQSQLTNAAVSKWFVLHDTTLLWDNVTRDRPRLCRPAFGSPSR